MSRTGSRGERLKYKESIYADKNLKTALEVSLTTVDANGHSLRSCQYRRQLASSFYFHFLLTFLNWTLFLSQLLD